MYNHKMGRAYPISFNWQYKNLQNVDFPFIRLCIVNCFARAKILKIQMKIINCYT